MANKIPAIPLSNNTVSRRIVEMSIDVKEQLVDSLKMSKKFALQLDESTDVAECAMLLLVYVRFINHIDTILQEEFLFLQNYLPEQQVMRYFNVWIPS